jgi:hypothetical protein
MGRYLPGSPYDRWSHHGLRAVDRGHSAHWVLAHKRSLHRPSEKDAKRYPALVQGLRAQSSIAPNPNPTLQPFTTSRKIPIPSRLRRYQDECDKEATAVAYDDGCIRSHLAVFSPLFVCHICPPQMCVCADESKRTKGRYRLYHCSMLLC